MADTNRFAIKITGASGMGIDSAGKILARVFKDSGYQVFAYREYPSLIKGGHSAYQIDVSGSEISSSSEYVDLVLAFERASVHEYLSSLKPGGTLIHNIPRLRLSEAESDLILERQLHIEHVNSQPLMEELGGLIFTNIFFLGMLCQLIGLDSNVLKELVREEYADKPKLVELDIKAIEMGCEYEAPTLATYSSKLQFQQRTGWNKSILIAGNEAIALGAISGGVRAYFGYPMTPSSSVLSYLSSNYHETGMLIKQAEDEITAAQMTLGAMFAGTRAMTGTSGGGFDLMTETVSLAGITEIPFVCVIAQRPGPATGVPTWTAAGDLNLAVYSGHGEFPRAVLAASDIESCYLLTQQALNLAEELQIPVFILTEKQIAESLYNIDKLPPALPIRRGLVGDSELASVKSEDRYAYTDSGVSKRWLPGQSEATYLSNSDEHLPDGTLTEDAAPVKMMMEKRMRKHQTLLEQLPEPILYGNANAKNILVGWGSAKGAILDAFNIAKNLDYAYLHYEYVWPLRTDKISELWAQEKNLILVENNYTGQLGNLLSQQAGVHFTDRHLKYDGRPFFVNDILKIIEK